MKGDFSRLTYRSAKHYQSVLRQQGRVELDADWNEQQAINLHRVETEALDVIGSSGAPKDDPGFGINLNRGDHISIGSGRIYVDGILCENNTEVAFTDQPYLKFPRDPVSEGWRDSDPTDHVIYLHVWRRLITALDDPLIREVALGGPDTATRVQTVWQVGLLNVTPAPFTSAPPPQPVFGDGLLRWDDMVAPSTGTMNARTQPADGDGTPSQLPPLAGYKGLENQLYRVEVHDPGDAGQATFKWSRDNGSVVTVIRAINGSTVTVDHTGSDEVPGFAVGRWVEVSDDYTELAGLTGQMAQIAKVDPATHVITLSTAVKSQFSLTNSPKLRRWDVAPTVGLGVLPVAVSPDNDGWIPLEEGVEVRFGDGTYRTGDYWVIPARIATGGVEWPPYGLPNTPPTPQPALGIDHHYCRLGMLHADPSSGEWSVIDCRDLFPPLTDVATALHVTALSWENDTPMEFGRFIEGGLRVTLDAAPEEDSVSNSSVVVTMEMPFSGRSSVDGELSFVLRGLVSVDANDIVWKMDDMLRRQVISSPSLSNVALRVRVLLKGRFIWRGRPGAEIYLDGDARGRQRPRDGAAPGTALVLPSGGGHREFDFESWFFVWGQKQ